jgi:hypothetical protein
VKLSLATAPLNGPPHISQPQQNAANAPFETADGVV